MSELNFFDKVFDFNHDGELGALEQGAKWRTVAHIMDEEERQEALEDTDLDDYDFD